MPIDSHYSLVPALVRDFLQTSEDLRDVPMVCITDRGVADQMMMALAGALPGPGNKVGGTLLIACAAGAGPIENIPAAFNDANQLLLVFYEMPVINHDWTRDDSLRIAGPDFIAACIAMLKRFRSVEAGFENLHFREARPPMDFPEVEPDTGLVLHRGRLLWAGGVEDNTATVATPVITIDHDTGLATITCETLSATITYTTDGSRPDWRSNAYGSPVDVSAVDVIRARAHRTGFHSSLIATQRTTASLLAEGGSTILGEGGTPLGT